MRKATLVKRQDGSLWPATEADKEITDSARIGEAFCVSISRMRPRSLQYHKRYWGGLLALAYHYWEPDGGLVTERERGLLDRLCKWASYRMGDSAAMRTACDAFLSDISADRAARLGAPHKSMEGLHMWVKRQAGLYDLVMTPSGVTVQVNSINFASMDQSEFEQFYRDAFSVIWRFILSRSFNSEEDAYNAISQLESLL